MSKDHPSSRRDRHRSPLASALVLTIIGLALFVPGILHHGLAGVESDDAIPGMILIALGIANFFRSRQLPKTQIMRLAESRKGLLSLSEITTALDIEPELAGRTLRALSKMGIAHQRWQEFNKNLWEFPDYMKLPIAETLTLAKQKGGRISLSDLIATGQSPETARDTLNALSQSGLAQQDPASNAGLPCSSRVNK